MTTTGATIVWALARAASSAAMQGDDGFTRTAPLIGTFAATRVTLGVVDVTCCILIMVLEGR